MIANCTCEHAYQDEKYGNGQRVHNIRVKEGKQIGYTCTVCGKKTLTRTK